MSDKKITFLIDKKSHEVPYESGDTVLDAAMKANLNPPYSCMEGMCTACLAQVLEGEVDFPPDTSLGDDEFKKGKILTCQAKPKATCSHLKISYDV